MSELELGLMRNRLDRGRQNKAARGEMFQKVCSVRPAAC